MLTMEGWKATEPRQNFTEYAEEGAEVELAIVEYFRDVVPPHIQRPDAIQCGEAHSADARGRTTYISFVRQKKGGPWHYRLCPSLAHKQDEQTVSLDALRGLLRRFNQRVAEHQRDARTVESAERIYTPEQVENLEAECYDWCARELAWVMRNHADAPRGGS